MQLIIKLNKESPSLLCVIDIFNKYAWVFSFKDKKVIAINNSCQAILDEPGCKPNKMLLDKGSEFDDSSIKL